MAAKRLLDIAGRKSPSNKKRVRRQKMKRRIDKARRGKNGLFMDDSEYMRNTKIY